MVQECTLTFLYLKEKKMHSYDESAEISLSETAMQFMAGI